MKKFLEKRETLFTILSFILAIASMAIIFSLLGRLVSGDLTSASIFLGISFLCEAGYNGILFFKYDKKRDMIRLTIVAFLFVVMAILAFVSNTGYFIFFHISTLLFFLTLSLNRFLMISKSKEKKWNITNFLTGALLLVFSIVAFVEVDEVLATLLVLLDSFVLLFMAFEKLVLPTIKFEKIKILFNILNVTHTLDVLICLLALMIAFSFLFPLVEDGITTFWDGLWYSFAVITTIGFGDFVATTIIGRVLTVILGLYGIVIVAIITSVIVNFYNAIADKNTEKKMDEIVQNVIEAKEQKEIEEKPKIKRTRKPKNKKEEK